MDTDVEQLSSTLDTDSSLRAAALLSRKRRKVVVDAPALPPRLAPEPLQLDYGHDDPAVIQVDGMLSPVVYLSTSQPPDHTKDVEDGQTREEGEISDTEASPPQHSPTPPPRLRQRPFSTLLQESGSFPPCSLSCVEAPPASPSEPSDTLSWHAASLEPFILETSTYRLDVNHVRPGLSMTIDQYNIAKDIVLDLLGWGVPPEYLLECGLSRHVIFYVFSELNLRLPSNLDTSGLIPFPTREMRALVPVSPSSSTPSLHSTMLPPSIIPARVPLAKRMSMEHIDTRMSSPEPSPYIKAEPSSPSSADLSNSHSLLVIEQQRRQELLARKAVIASRKVRQSEPPHFSIPTKDLDIDMSVAPAQSVDDFLKTIEPPSPLNVGDDDDDHIHGSFVHTNSFSSLDRTNVDDLIPGLIGASRDASTPVERLPSSQPMSPPTVAARCVELRSPMALLAAGTDITSDRTELGSATSVDMIGSRPFVSAVQGNPNFASLDGDNSYPQRRKRPVAADFVDFDSGPGFPRGHGSTSSNGHFNGGPYPNSLTRRKAGSFAGISGMRRCVIELSDSEDDGDNQMIEDQAGCGGTREYSPAIATTRAPLRRAVTPTVPLSLGSSGVGNGNSGQSLPSASATNALAEKEEEIKRMRQLIARREELRLKKLATVSEKPTPAATVQMLDGTVGIQQAETYTGPTESNNSPTLLPARDWEHDHPSVPRVTRRQATADGKPDLVTSDDSATLRILGTPGPTGSWNLSAQETSTIGRELSVQDGESEDDLDLTVAGETHSAQVVSASKEAIHQESLAAGDSGTSSSAQVLRLQLPQSQNESPQLSRSGFPLYDSPLSRYPLLQPRFGPDTNAGNTSLVALQSETTSASQASAHNSSSPSVHFLSPISCTTAAVSSHPSSPIPFPDLKGLKQAVLHRLLAQLTRRRPDLRVCPYEVPGGGVCRDRDCGELHLSQISREPSDTEVAAYVHEHLAQPWSGRCDVRAIEIALEGVRLRGGATDVDSQVREALGGLGIPMMTALT